VELLDVVFRDRNLRPSMEDGLHELGVPATSCSSQVAKDLISRLASRRST
jgi:hypothetical protein